MILNDVILLENNFIDKETYNNFMGNNLKKSQLRGRQKKFIIKTVSLNNVLRKYFNTFYIIMFTGQQEIYIKKNSHFFFFLISRLASRINVNMNYSGLKFV